MKMMSFSLSQLKRELKENLRKSISETQKNTMEEQLKHKWQNQSLPITL